MRAGKIICKKLNSRKGTTLAETLAAFIIIVLAVTMLCNVIIQSVSITRTGEQIKEQNQALVMHYWEGATLDAGKTSEMTMKFVQGGVTYFKIKKVKLNAYECIYHEGASDEYKGYMYDFSKEGT